jgi:predicted lipid-binding transport protein (Tim44 family)
MKIGTAMRRFAPMLLALMIALAPALAGARPGSGMSLGSRGSHTWSSTPGMSSAPMQRSMTPNSGGYGSSYGTSSYGQSYGGGYGMRPRSAFTSGLMGGLIGAGIGGMLFGHGFFGGMNGGGSIIGLLLQLFLLYWIGSWIYRRFFAGNLAMAGGGGMFGRMMNQGQAARPAFGGGGPSGRPLALVQSDYQAFDQLLHSIQAAWTAHDLNALGTMATPEMVSYFAEQLAEQTSRGVRNFVTGVSLQKGDLSEAWSEGSREYATVSMRFSMIDVTKDAAGRVVDGSPNERVTVTEIWTFLRAPGGRWVLSAIQQAR